jgi:hypothetical protein
MLTKDIKPLMEAYANIYNSTTEVVEEDLLTDELIEEIIEELVEECVESGYDLDESLEIIEEAATEYLAELNPYAPAGSKEARAYNKSTTATKRGEERKAAVKAAVGKVKAKAAGAAVSAYAAGKSAKEGIKSAAGAVKSGAQRTAGAVSSAAQSAKAGAKAGVKKLLGKGLRAVAGGAGRAAQVARKVGSAAGQAASRLGEETDIFDLVLEFLQAEGYAETLEEAEWMMANVIDEEAIGIILGEAITSEKGKAKAAEMIAKRSTPSGRAKAGQGASVAAIKHISRANVDGYGGTPPNLKVAKNPVKSNFTGLNTGTGNKAARRAAALKKEEFEFWVDALVEEGYDLSGYTWDEMYEFYLDEASRRDEFTRAAIARYAGKKGISFEPGPNWDPSANRGRGAHLNPKQKEKQRRKALRQEEYVDEAQEARNNPEKYEREQDKKYAPVRGERTPMPPRGNKRREDFEKWYAKHVR